MSHLNKLDRQKDYIRLFEFRRENNILQKDLANYLGISRGYISVIETQKSPIPWETLEKIFNNPYHWNTKVLVPCWHRISQLLTYINETRNAQREMEGLAPEYFHVEENLLKKIKYGDSAIPNHLAKEIVAKAPEINMDWILTGAGDMIKKEETPTPTHFEVLEQKIDGLTAEIQECKTLIYKIAKAFVEAFESTE